MLASGYRATVVCSILACAYVVNAVLTKRSRKSLPPGPPTDFILGHARILPDPNSRAEVFYEWSRKYGDVFCLTVLGQHIIVLNSEKAAFDLLERRSAIYSSRPKLPIYERVGWKNALVFAPYGHEMNEQRRLLQQPLSKPAIILYQHMQEQEVNNLLKGLLDHPDDYDRHARRLATGLILNVTYGYQVESFEDEYFQMAEHITSVLTGAGQPSLLDIFPWLDKLPAWFPGAWFVRYIQTEKPKVEHIINAPVKRVQEEMSKGQAAPSFVSQHLETMSTQANEDPDEMFSLKMSAHMLFAGGSGTSAHTITTFIACMLLNPEVQARGQVEIDRVIGRGRLPDFSDRDALPYIDCIAQETMRWHPVLPSGIPHYTTADDIYEGMFIPKGSIVFANTRSITWNETTFHDPRSFKPERFLPKPHGAGEVFPTNAVYGWGRRICPGRYLGDTNVWIAVARILAVFTISKVKDAEGCPIESDIKFETGLTSYPLPFECDIHPRDEQAARLIRDSHLMTQSA